MPEKYQAYFKFDNVNDESILNLSLLNLLKIL